MSPRFLCTGDLHLGAGAAYGREPGERLAEQETVLQRIADLAIERECDAVLNAGDTFEGPSIPPEQLDVFARFVARCREAGIPIVATLGNGRHDASMRTVSGLAIFEHIPGITISSLPEVHELAGVQVATLPWTPVSRLVAAAGGGDRAEINAQAAALLAQTALELRARIAITDPAILMFHWSVTGAVLPNGLPVDQLHEPILELGALEVMGWDAIVMGHIHKPQAVLGGPGVLYDPTVDHARAFYVGSPLPLNFGEAGCDHGVWLLELDGTQASIEFVPIESRRFVTLDVDVTVDSADDATAALHCQIGFHADELRDAILKIRYHATAEQARRIDHAAIKQALYDAGAHHVYQIQPEILREDRPKVEGLDDTLDELEALELYLATVGVNGDTGAALRDLTDSYLREATTQSKGGSL